MNTLIWVGTIGALAGLTAGELMHRRRAIRRLLLAAWIMVVRILCPPAISHGDHGTAVVRVKRVKPAADHILDRFA